MAEEIELLKRPVITVITVVYNAVSLVEDTIKSVISQRYDDVEYILVDGGSTDGTVDIIKSYEKNIAHWVSESDKGIYDAMNRAIDMASGDWINFLNAGDTFFSEYSVEQMVANLSCSVSVVYGDSMIKDGTHLFVARAKQMSPTNLIFWGTRTVCHQAMFVRRSVCVHYNIKYILKAELDWYFELLERGAQVKYVPMPVCIYALGGLSDRLFKLEMTETIKVMIKRHSFLAMLHIPIFVYKVMRRIFR
jgi:glycosyltransferase involved in cell wall biosynthesis